MQNRQRTEKYVYKVWDGHAKEKNISQTVALYFSFKKKPLQFDFKSSSEMKWCLKSNT